MSKEKSYVIKVPVYTTEMVEKESPLFGENYHGLVRAVQKKVEEYVGGLSIENKNKTYKTVINNIDASEHKIGDIPCLLLKISAYTTNLQDGYFEAAERFQFEKENKIGSDNNYFLIYPVIIGLESHRYVRYFLLLVYVDPNKNISDLIKIVKGVAKKVLCVPVKNIKPQGVLNELSQMRTIPELEIVYTGISNSDNDVEVKYREYLQRGSVKRTKSQYFKDMPFDLTNDLLQDTDDSGDYQKKKTIFRIGKNEYRITRDLRNEAEEHYKETAEKVFNTSIGITQSELDSNKIYQPDFIIDKMGDVIANYMASEEEG